MILSALFALGSLITLASGELLKGYSVTPGGTSTLDYGFPWAWKLVVTQDCSGGFTLAPCQLNNVHTEYNWAFFGLDTLFYFLAGCGLVAIYRGPVRSRIFRS